jgi:hypothetical protein
MFQSKITSPPPIPIETHAVFETWSAAPVSTNANLDSDKRKNRTCDNTTKSGREWGIFFLWGDFFRGIFT